MKLATGNLTAVTFGALMILTACAAVGPPLPPSLELPRPPSDLQATRKGNQVTLTWTVPSSTTDRQTIRSLGPTSICRGVDVKLAQCGAPVGQIAPANAKPATNSSKQKTTATYVDAIPAELLAGDSTAEITYAVEVSNASGRSAGLSNEVRVSAVRTLQPPPNVRAEVTKDGVLVSWPIPPPLGRAPAAQFTHRLRVYRRQQSGSAIAKLAELPYIGGFDKLLDLVPGNTSGEQKSEHVTEAQTKIPDSFLDQSFTWEQTYFYHLAVVTVIAEPGKSEVSVEGEDSVEVKVFAHDVFPPSVPASLQAVFSGPGQRAFIDLIWAPVTDVDLEGYNVYRHEAGAAAVKVNAELLKTPAYRDENVEAGNKYFYSVSAVDARGNESARSEEASESVP